jgi:hypothetical protein
MGCDSLCDAEAFAKTLGEYLIVTASRWNQDSYPRVDELLGLGREAYEGSKKLLKLHALVLDVSGEEVILKRICDFWRVKSSLPEWGWLLNAIFPFRDICEMCLNNTLPSGKEHWSVETISSPTEWNTYYSLLNTKMWTKKGMERRKP